MLQKRSVGHDLDALPPDKRFRSNLADAFLSNEMTGQRAQTLFNDSQLAGIANVSDIVRYAAAPTGGARAGKKQQFPNAHRNLMWKLLKGNRWPDWFWSHLTIWNPKKNREEKVLWPFLLPDEVAAEIAAGSDVENLLERTGLNASARNHLANEELEIDCPSGKLLGFGLWSDGVLYCWRKDESFHVCSFCLPGLSGKWGTLRFPVTVVEEKYMVKGKTIDVSAEVLRRAFVRIARGQRMDERDDGWVISPRIAFWRCSVMKDSRQTSQTQNPVLVAC